MPTSVERDQQLMALLAKWRVEKGQIWEIAGRLPHYAYCGDSRNEKALQWICQEPVVGLFTSPPYLGQRKYETDKAKHTLIAEWSELMEDVFSAVAQHLSSHAQIFVNLGLVHNEGRVIRYWDRWLDHMENFIERPLLAWNVWDKLYPVPGNHYGRFAPQHEWIFHFTRKGIGPDKIVPATNAGKAGKSGRKHTQGETYGNGEWTAATDIVAPFKIPGSVVAQSVPGGFREKDPGAKAAQLHPARFPIELPAFHMRAYKNLLPQGPWLDPFAGSFTTLLAGEREGVATYMMENEPRYFAAALERCALEGLQVTKMYDSESTQGPEEAAPSVGHRSRFGALFS